MAARLGGVNSGSAWKPNTDLKKREDNTKTKGLVLCHIFIFKVMTQPCPYCNDSCVDTAGWSWFQHMHHCIVVTMTRTCPRSYPLEVHALALASHNKDLSQKLPIRSACFSTCQSQHGSVIEVTHQKCMFQHLPVTTWICPRSYPLEVHALALASHNKDLSQKLPIRSACFSTCQSQQGSVLEVTHQKCMLQHLPVTTWICPRSYPLEVHVLALASHNMDLSQKLPIRSACFSTCQSQQGSVLEVTHQKCMLQHLPVTTWICPRSYPLEVHVLALASHNKDLSQKLPIEVHALALASHNKDLSQKLPIRSACFSTCQSQQGSVLEVTHQKCMLQHLPVTTRICPRSYPLEVHALALASHNKDLSQKLPIRSACFSTCQSQHGSVLEVTHQKCMLQHLPVTTRICPRSYPLEVHALALASHNKDLSQKLPNRSACFSTCQSQHGSVLEVTHQKCMLALASHNKDLSQKLPIRSACFSTCQSQQGSVLEVTHQKCMFQHLPVTTRICPRSYPLEVHVLALASHHMDLSQKLPIRSACFSTCQSQQGSVLEVTHQKCMFQHLPVTTWICPRSYPLEVHALALASHNKDLSQKLPIRSACFSTCQSQQGSVLEVTHQKCMFQHLPVTTRICPRSYPLEVHVLALASHNKDLSQKLPIRSACFSTCQSQQGSVLEVTHQKCMFQHLPVTTWICPRSYPLEVHALALASHNKDLSQKLPIRSACFSTCQSQQGSVLEVTHQKCMLQHLPITTWICPRSYPLEVHALTLASHNKDLSQKLPIRSACFSTCQSQHGSVLEVTHQKCMFQHLPITTWICPRSCLYIDVVVS